MKEVIIDLSKKNKLNEFLSPESWTARNLGLLLHMTILDDDFGIPVKILGSRGDVDSFAKALSAERGNMQAIEQFGLNNPETYRSSSQLRNAISNFESRTGLRWPFDH